MKEHEDLIKKFHKLEEWFQDDIKLECNKFTPNDIKNDSTLKMLCNDYGSTRPESLRAFFWSEYNSWDQRQANLLEKEEWNDAEQLASDYQTIYEPEATDRIFDNAEKYYEDGWDLNENALHKFVVSEIIAERAEEAKHLAELYEEEPGYESFTVREWEEGLSILSALKTVYPKGTTGTELRWLRLALAYNRFFCFFNKEKYKRGIIYESQLCDYISYTTAKQELKLE